MKAKIVSYSLTFFLRCKGVLWGWKNSNIKLHFHPQQIYHQQQFLSLFTSTELEATIRACFRDVCPAFCHCLDTPGYFVQSNRNCEQNLWMAQCAIKLPFWLSHLQPFSLGTSCCIIGNVINNLVNGDLRKVPELMKGKVALGITITGLLFPYWYSVVFPQLPMQQSCLRGCCGIRG